MIETGEQLAYLGNQVNGGTAYEGKFFKLTANIRLNNTTSPDWTTWNDTTGPTNTWTPIGRLEAKPFKGTFDGDNHTISGMYISTNSNNQGLFGFVGVDGSTIGVVKNVGVTKSYVWSGYGNSGGMAAYNYGTMENCYNTGNVSVGASRAGGVVGVNFGKVISCYNTGRVDGTSNVGGVTGSNAAATSEITNCYNEGAITGTDINVGGVAGSLYGLVINCYNKGNVNGTTYVGGVAGNKADATSVLKNCYNEGAITGTGSSVGGVAGIHAGLGINCYNKGNVNGTNFVGGITGYNSGTIKNCYSMGGITGQVALSGTVVGINVDSNSIVVNCYAKTIPNISKLVGDNAGAITNCSAFGENKKLTSSGSVSVGSNGVLAVFSKDADLKTTLNAGVIEYNKSTPPTPLSSWVQGGNNYPTLGIGFSIDEKPIVVIYDGNNHPFIVKSIPEGVTGCTLTYQKNNGGFTADVPKEVGSYNVKVTRAEDATYVAFETTIPNGVAITQATNSIANLAIADWVFGGTAKTPTATALFGTPTFTYSNAQNGSYTASMPSLDVGTYWVKASVAEATNYTAAEAKKSFAITKATLPTITYPTASTIAYGGKLSTATLTGGSVAFGAFAWTNGAEIPTVANSGYSVTFTPNALTLQNYTCNASYTKTVALTVTPATITTTPFVGFKGVYDGITHSLTAGTPTTVNSQVAKIEYSKDNATWSTAQPTVTDVSTTTVHYKITAPNHTELTGSVTIKITRKGVTKPTIATEQTYSGANIVGIKDVVKLAGYSIVGDYQAIDVKTGGYSATFTPDGNHCWGADSGADTAAVTIAWNITPLTAELLWSIPSASDLVYGGSAKVLTATVKNLKMQGTIADTCVVTVAPKVADSNIYVSATPFTFQATKLSNDNYAMPKNADSPSYNITKKPIIKINVNKKFTVGDAKFIVELSNANCEGVVGNDKVTINFETSAAVAGEYKGEAGIPGSVTLTGARAGDYSVDKAQIVANIVKELLPPIDITATKPYNGSEQAPTVTLAGATIGTDYTLAWEYKAVDGTSFAPVAAPKFINAGVYKVNVTGTDGGKFPGTNQSAEYEITQIEVTLTWSTPYTFVFDGTNKIPSVEVGGVLAGDTFAVTAGLTSGNNSEVNKFIYTATSTETGANYKLPAVVTKEYEITQATNVWTNTATPLSIADITFGEELKPIADSLFGKAEFVYYGDSDGDGNQDANPLLAPPTEAGTYWVTASVDGHKNYSALSATSAVKFIINKKSAGGGGSGSGSTGIIAPADVFWMGIIIDIKHKDDIVLNRECDYSTIPNKVLDALKESNKTLNITMQGETLSITGEKAKKLTFDKSEYTIAELKAMLADKPAITPTPTEKPTEPTVPETPANLTWLWVLLGILALSVVIAVVIVIRKKK